MKFEFYINLLSMLSIPVAIISLAFAHSTGTGGLYWIPFSEAFGRIVAGFAILVMFSGTLASWVMVWRGYIDRSAWIAPNLLIAVLWAVVWIAIVTTP